jgi:hypothetical protein
VYVEGTLYLECETSCVTLQGLEPDKCYQISVTAMSSDNGEGYKSKVTFMCKTMRDSGLHELYVWGNN